MSGCLPTHERIEVEGVKVEYVADDEALGRVNANFVGRSRSLRHQMRRLRVFALHVFAVAEIEWVKLGKRILENEKIYANIVVGWGMGRDHKDIKMCERERVFKRFEGTM